MEVTRPPVVTPVADADAVGPGEKIIVEYRGREVGIYNVDGELFALRNRCPHHGGPLCRGTFGRTTLPSAPQEMVLGGQVAMCPWHHFEFDLTTGECLTDSKMRVKPYKVTVVDGKIMLGA
jgi:nitrite reductase (NADH) small subunit